MAVIAVLAFVAIACGDDDDDGDGVVVIGSVDVLGIWGDEELLSFEAMVALWEAATGGTMEFTGQRGVGALITTRVEGGNPPDVAIPAEVGLFRDFARNGDLIPLSNCAGLEDAIRNNYPDGFIELGTVDGTLYGFFMKADIKGTIWYNPTFFEANGYQPLTAASTFDDLLALSQQIADDGVVPPWSIGVESGDDSGWPGTDWFQVILLNEPGGAEVNDGLIDGSIPFTDDRVKAAWEKFGDIALTEGWVSQGGAEGINATNFVDAIFPLFEDPPTAALHHQASFVPIEIAAQFPNAVAGEDYNFFPWPGGAAVGSSNIVYAFNDDPTTCSFLSHLASADAQQVWVDRGGFISVNTALNLDAYPDAVTRAAAQALTEVEVLRFDIDDTIGGTVQRAFFAGATQYLADPDSLDSILAALEAARE